MVEGLDEVLPGEEQWVGWMVRLLMSIVGDASTWLNCELGRGEWIVRLLKPYVGNDWSMVLLGQVFGRRFGGCIWGRGLVGKGGNSSGL